MSLVGNLADLSLGDIFQIVQLSRRSGTLQLTTPLESGEIVFVEGSVVGSYRTQGDASVGEGLLHEGAVSATELQELMHHETAGVQGRDLLTAADVDSERVQEGLRCLLQNQIFAMFEWREGRFSFVLGDRENLWSSFSVGGTRIAVDPGVSPQFLAMEGARRRDELAQRDSLHAFLARDGGSGPSDPNHARNVERFAERLRAETVDEIAAAQGDAEAANAGNEAIPPQGDRAVESPGLASKSEFVAERGETVASAEPGQSSAVSKESEPTPQEASLEAAPESEPHPDPGGDLRTHESPPQIEAETGEPEDTQAAGLAPASTGWTLVFIDDDPEILEFARDALESRFARMETFALVADALERIEREPRGVVVATDLIISRTDGRGILGGIEVLEAMHSLAEAVPVLIFTDYKNVEAERRAQELGALALLHKPRKAQLGTGKGAQCEPSEHTKAFFDELREALEPHSGGREETEEAAEPFDLGRELVREDNDLGLTSIELPPRLEVNEVFAELRSMLAELSDPANRDTVTLLALRFAAAFVERAALFLVTRNAFVGLGGFTQGEASDSFVIRVRRLQIPCDVESILARVMRFRSMIRGPLADTPGNAELLAGLGDPTASALAVPLISGGRVAAILYGDNPSGKALGRAESLEIFMQQAGIAMDRALLERRLKEAEAEKPGQT